MGGNVHIVVWGNNKQSRHIYMLVTYLFFLCYNVLMLKTTYGSTQTNQMFFQ